MHLKKQDNTCCYLSKNRLCLLMLLALISAVQIVQAQTENTAVYKTIASPLLQSDTAVINDQLSRIELLNQTQPDSALVLLHTLMTYEQDKVMQTFNGKVFTFAAVCYLRKGDYKRCEQLLEKAFHYVRKSGDREMLSYLHNVNAIIYQQSGLYTKSINHYLQALELAGKDLSDKRIIQTYINFGGFWSIIGENKQALKYYDLASGILASNKRTDPYITMNIGIAKSDSSNDFAISKFKEALNILNQKNDVHLANKLYVNLSEAYRINRQYDSALFYLQKAEIASHLFNTNTSLALYHSEAGQLYLELGDTKRAETELRKALKCSDASHTKELSKEIHEVLARVYEQKRDFKNAFMHQTYAIQLQDSLDKSEKVKTLDLMLDYQKAEQNRLIASNALELNKKENQLKQRNIWLALILVLFLGVIGIVISAFRNSRNKQKWQKNELALLRQTQEVERLKALSEGEEKERNRIAHELHDSVMVEFASVKMQLNALPQQYPEMAASENHKRIVQQMDRATKELRLTAHNLMPDLLLDEGLIQAMYYFCNNIQKTSGLPISFQHIGLPLPRFIVDFEILIYRTVQEIIQNIIKHAAAGRALIQIQYDGEYLSITIEDNGKGFDRSQEQEGMGLRSIKNRLQMFHSQLDIKSVMGLGTTVLIESQTKTLILEK